MFGYKKTKEDILKKDRSTTWMTVSGTTAVIFFLISNFSNIDARLNLYTGIAQIAINIFVFVAWLNGFSKSTGLKKIIAIFGVVFPPIMITITLVRVIIKV